MINNDSALVIFDSILLKKYASKIKPTQYIVPYTQNGIFIWNNKDKDWSTDNFGPLKIPANCYFVLGDNRHNALDSRYIGFIKKENINGVVLNK
jgi:signal peptidase I